MYLICFDRVFRYTYYLIDIIIDAVYYSDKYDFTILMVNSALHAFLAASAVFYYYYRYVYFVKYTNLLFFQRIWK